MPILSLVFDTSDTPKAALRPAKLSALFLVLVSLMMSGITLSSSEASAARAVQVLNYENQPVTASLTAAEVKKGIMKASARRGWKVKETGPGELTAMVQVRTHTATVTIAYSSNSYSIMYKDSTNLNYKDGKIHGNYNKWVTFLKTDIDLELSF